MKFRYVGAGESPPNETTTLGLTFVRGESVDVTDEAVIAKLDGNKSFERVKRGRPPKARDDGINES